MASTCSRLPPPSFGFVMATGILAVGAHQQGWPRLALAAFALASVAWVLLGVQSCLRLAQHPREVLADLQDHQRAPGFFTAVAGTGVLAGGCLVLDLGVAVGAALGALALLLWLLVTYGVFAALITAQVKPALDRGIGGAWLLAVVACQSVSVVAGLLSAHVPQPWRLQLNFLALCTWLFAGMLYTWVIALIFYRALFFRFAPADLAPPYWINMGAMAISTLAGAQLVLDAPAAPLLTTLLPFVQGFSILYWATGTWWLPLLVVLTLWRYGLRREPVRPDAFDWSAVFPLGMFPAASTHLSHAGGRAFPRPLASVFFWLGILAWLATCGAQPPRLRRIDSAVLL